MVERVKKAPEIVVSVDYVMPQHVNNHGTMFGGALFEMMDKTAAIASLRFCECPVVTACIDTIDFKMAIPQKSILELVARTIYTSQSSLVVQVEVFMQPRIGGKKKLATRGNIVFVAVDESGKPCSIPDLCIQTNEEKLLWEQGARVKAAYLSRK